MHSHAYMHRAAHTEITEAVDWVRAMYSPLISIWRTSRVPSLNFSGVKRKTSISSVGIEGCQCELRLSRPGGEERSKFQGLLAAWDTRQNQILQVSGMPTTSPAGLSSGVTTYRDLQGIHPFLPLTSLFSLEPVTSDMGIWLFVSLLISVQSRMHPGRHC